MRRTTFERNFAWLDVLDNRFAIGERAYGHAIARNGHVSLATHAAQLCQARLAFAVDRHPRGIASGGDDEAAPRLFYPQDCDLLAPNDDCLVTYRTVKAEGTLDDPGRRSVEAFARAQGGCVRWRTSEDAARTYGLLELPAAATPEVGTLDGVTVYDAPVIALAVFPTVAEALPPLCDALGGSGRPAGIRACDAVPGGIIVEWDLDRTTAAVVLGAIDVELRRFNSGRTAEVLTPLPLPWTARIAADAVQAPEMSADRVLEELLERAGLHD